MRLFEYGEQVLLWEVKRGRTFSFVLKEGDVFHSHKGSIPHGEIAGKPEGARVVSSTGAEFVAFRPRLPERMMKVRRRTQIVYPKDAGWLALALDIRPGMRVVEIGTGSGAFTILLAQLVGPEGRIYTFDRREDFLKNALENIARAGLSDRVEAGILEAGNPFPVKGDVDAVFIDLPEPWLAVPPAYRVLSPGRPLAGIVPTAEQLKGFVSALERAGFVAVECVELLERKVLVREREGVRPFERMVGFTGYLVSARKALKEGSDEEDRGAG
ncbi:TPA: tRNA (adenine-N1)-methyltransferase [Candidatus Micrarchaeota archaeon]|nr:tRNA (adenine-N1)-methyltransferase [Candidatus Micrarchaeota archaeon]